VVKSLWDAFDTHASAIAADMDLVVGAISGAHNDVYRADPSARGLGQLMARTDNHGAIAFRLAHDGFRRFIDDSVQFRTHFSTESPYAAETLSIALQQLRALVEQTRLASARRFRAALVSRSSIAPPVAGSLRIMNRAGQQFRANEAFYLATRKALIDLFNEGQIQGLVEAGFTHAVSFNKDPGHATNGQVLRITSQPDDSPHYADVQDTWFHPRSNAALMGWH
jgi:hypothetical protein